VGERENQGRRLPTTAEEELTIFDFFKRSLREERGKLKRQWRDKRGV